MMRLIAIAMVLGTALGSTGCEKAPEPTTPPVVGEGQTAKERAMQGMPADMQQRYRNGVPPERPR